jgi:hypothetical protein
VNSHHGGTAEVACFEPASAESTVVEDTYGVLAGPQVLTR